MIRKGWVKRRKIYNEAPQGYAGFCFNMRKPPFDTSRRAARLRHLFNREALFEKLFFNEYEFIDSYFPGRDWGNEKNNPKIRYDPDKAEELLFFAGYEERDDEGYLIDPDGKRLSVTLEFANQQWERIWLVVKEYYEQAGIEFDLKLLDGTTLSKKVYEHQFRIHFQSWGAILFPNPETRWRSRSGGPDLQQQHARASRTSGSTRSARSTTVTFERGAAEGDHPGDRLDHLRRAPLRVRLDLGLPARSVLGPVRPSRHLLVADRRPDRRADGAAYWWWDPERMKQPDAGQDRGTRSSPTRSRSS